MDQNVTSVYYLSTTSGFSFAEGIFRLADINDIQGSRPMLKPYCRPCNMYLA